MKEVYKENESEPETLDPLSIDPEERDEGFADGFEADGNLCFETQLPAIPPTKDRSPATSKQSIDPDDEQRAASADFKTQARRRPDVYAIVAAHQVALAEWDFSKWVHAIRIFADLFIKRFELEIPLPPVRVERLNVKVDGYFHAGLDGYALAGALVFNQKRLGQLPLFQALALLLKMLLCAWQGKHGSPGRPGYFNQEFRAKAEDLGLRIDQRGAIAFAPSGPFQSLLAECGIAIPADAAFSTERPKGKSTNLLFTCGCQIKGRFGVRYVPWVCRLCGQEVRRVEWQD